MEQEVVDFLQYVLNLSFWNAAFGCNSVGKGDVFGYDDESD
jgi:hypothetical protein